jgi:bifunctional UDP-N-acetylglucosamine pyrophosphorylase/glucosamine-1-phosphate N-acetyltransferase
MTGRLVALILAAGKGRRFKSGKPKVLHPILGKPMVGLVVESVERLKPEELYVVIGADGEEARTALAGHDVHFINQKEGQGSGRAVFSAESALRRHRNQDVLVVPGDMPLIRPGTLKNLIEIHRRHGASVTALCAHPSSPGRVIIGEGENFFDVRGRNQVPLDKDGLHPAISDVFVFNIRALLQALSAMTAAKKDAECELGDIFEKLRQGKYKTAISEDPRVIETLDVNTRRDMALAIMVLRQRKAQSLLDRGVTVIDPSSAWIDLDVAVGAETFIYPSVVIEGKTSIGKGCSIYPHVHIMNSRIGNQVSVYSSSVLDGVTVEDGVQVGPFSRLRPETRLRSGSRVGNFVEMKKTVFGRRSKALHLSYLGDTTVEEDVNVGAGTITCNYDGFTKSRTHIGRGAFIGSGTELIAPVKVGRKSYVAAGSTITEDVNDGALAIARARQIEKPGWARRRRK